MWMLPLLCLISQCQRLVKFFLSLKSIYFSYLKENNKKIGTDGSDDDYKIWQCHDCTHVIFGNGVTFEEESINDLHGLILCSYEWKDYLAYFKDPFLKNHMKY